MFDRITFDPQIMGGRACIRGMRIPVSVIVGQIAHGATFEEILEGYPDLEKEDIQQAVEYAAWLTQEEIHFRSGSSVRFVADMCMDVRVAELVKLARAPMRPIYETKDFNGCPTVESSRRLSPSPVWW